MTVFELITFLLAQPQDLPVAFGRYSEYCLLEEGQIAVFDACLPREDGWVHSARPDKPVQTYLMLPGN